MRLSHHNLTMSPPLNVERAVHTISTDRPTEARSVDRYNGTLVTMANIYALVMAYAGTLCCRYYDYWLLYLWFPVSALGEPLTASRLHYANTLHDKPGMKTKLHLHHAFLPAA